MDDEGVSEVVGFILSFALSALFLMLAMASFWSARDNTDAVVVAAEFRSIADRVSNRIVEAGLVAQDFPNATINMTVALPAQINAHSYRVTADVDGVTVVANDAAYTATASLYNLNKLSDVSVAGDVQSSFEHLIVTYSIQNPNAATPDRHIYIHGS